MILLFVSPEEFYAISLNVGIDTVQFFGRALLMQGATLQITLFVS